MEILDSNSGLDTDLLCDSRQVPSLLWLGFSFFHLHRKEHESVFLRFFSHYNDSLGAENASSLLLIKRAN
jgi:hypothetical protein